VTTDDVRTTSKVIGREREEEDNDDEEKKRQKTGEGVGEEVEEKMGGDSEEISLAQTMQGWPRICACPFLPPSFGGLVSHRSNEPVVGQDS
jgi:hypothetical protein